MVGQTVGHAVAERCAHVRCARGMRSTGGKNGGTAATSSGLNPRNGPNSFVFYFIITIKHNIVFRNYRLVHNKYHNHLINCIECLTVISRRSSNVLYSNTYIFYLFYILQYFFVSFFNFQSNILSVNGYKCITTKILYYTFFTSGPLTWLYRSYKIYRYNIVLIIFVVVKIIIITIYYTYYLNNFLKAYNK